MTGRLFGTRELSVEQISKIVELTEEGCSKRDIARAADCDPKTVYRLQNKLDLI
jgi:hypothetical protein